MLVIGAPESRLRTARAVGASDLLDFRGRSQPERIDWVHGHTDGRGSREYNLALGEKRAEGVVKSLALLGVAPSQVEAVSFGEERPAVQASDESAWAKNRRAELKDR